MATNNAVISDIVASQPPKASVVGEARRSLVIPNRPNSIVEAEKTPDAVDVELTDSSEPGLDLEKYPPPTEEEKATLRKISDTLPWIAWTLCFVEFAERASYYGSFQIFSNFLQFKLPEGGNGAGAPPKGSEKSAGALGFGLTAANAFVLTFKFMAYAMPMFGAWIADAKIGRYRAIVIGVLICGVSHVIQVAGAAPKVLQEGHGRAPFLISLFLLAIGAGIFKPAILPTLLDQYRVQTPYIRTLKSGERVIVDPEATVQRTSLLFYGFVNIGAIFPLATTFIEKKYGFWLAFLLPAIVYFLLPFLLLATYKKTYRAKPKGSELTDVAHIVSVALKRNKGMLWKAGFWEAAKPSRLAAEGVTTFRGKQIPWSDKLVDDVRRTFAACLMFLYFPLWYLNDGGIGSVSTSQASTMTTNGVPNDLINNLNPLTVIIFVPLLTYVIYPILQRYKIRFAPINRIVFGFTLAWISSVAGALLQWHIYRTSPCGNMATDCEKGDGVSPLSAWAQAPVFILGASSECFVQVTAYELAYSRSPPNMKSLVMAWFLLMNALSSALALIISPAIKDPNLTWVWAGPAIALFCISVVFWFQYRWMNHDDFMIYEDDKSKTTEGTTAEPEVAQADEKRSIEQVESNMSGEPKEIKV